MQPSEITELSYLFPSNPNQYFPVNFSLNNNNIPAYQFSNLVNPLYQLNNNTQFQELNTPQQTSLSSNSTSDEADEQQLSIINERRQRRMISNRESARRSRMRKQKHLDELWSQVMWLRDENHQLVNKLNHVCENHDQVVRENARLKEETLELREMITNMQLNSPYPGLSGLEDDPCIDLA
ncbi:basic-leucine zipper transcription factor family protein [Striga asiatica]|uniref:Basic-leucine zipper transcription factor family protein n=1 Tax=Striga asiatica TaxID=4170 RepID=A0A5A7QVJ9_STRAF|nr:basic-leucine zipper transcription factor family protein [Striga asiatica]